VNRRGFFGALAAGLGSLLFPVQYDPARVDRLVFKLPEWAHEGTEITLWHHKDGVWEDGGQAIVLPCDSPPMASDSVLLFAADEEWALVDEEGGQ